MSRRPVAPLWDSSRLGHAAGIASGVVWCRLDRRWRKRLRRIGEQFGRVVGHRLIRINDRIGSGTGATMPIDNQRIIRLRIPRRWTRVVRSPAAAGLGSSATSIGAASAMSQNAKAPCPRLTASMPVSAYIAVAIPRPVAIAGISGQAAGNRNRTVVLRATGPNAYFQRKWTKTRPKLSESFSPRW